MLDFPCVVVTKPIGQFDLSQSVLIKLPFIVHAPGAGQLQFIKDYELHGWFPVRLLAPECATGSRPCQVRRGRRPHGSARGRPRTAAGVWPQYKAGPDIPRRCPEATTGLRRE